MEKSDRLDLSRWEKIFFIRSNACHVIPLKEGAKELFYLNIHKPGPLAAITSMTISVLTAPVSVLISVTLLVSILVFHASVSVIKTQAS